MEFDYIVADPTGNITVLITSPYTADNRSEMIREAFRLVPECEQVGFVRQISSNTVRLEMMAYEFCGNATLSAAAWLAGKNDLETGRSSVINVESSGVDEILSVNITRLKAGMLHDQSAGSDNADADDAARVYVGSVSMPIPVVSSFRGYPLVSFDGISHLIVPADAYEDAAAETVIKEYADELGVSALGLMLLSECDAHAFTSMSSAFSDRYQPAGSAPDPVVIRPLVYVPGSDTIIWEHGCATGSTAVGWYRYCSSGIASSDIHQPGGTIRIDTSSGRPLLTGSVILRA